MTLSIHLRNLLTRVYTPGKEGLPQPWPHEMIPVSTQRPPSLWQTRGPPLSPWQLSTRWRSDRLPAHSIRLVKRSPYRFLHFQVGSRGTQAWSRVREYSESDRRKKAAEKQVHVYLMCRNTTVQIRNSLLVKRLHNISNVLSWLKHKRAWSYVLHVVRLRSL